VTAAEVVRGFLDGQEIAFEEPAEGVFFFALPGERKLQTPFRVEVGVHALAVRAFVCRRPDENHEGVYRWLLERNMKAFGAGFAIDRLGDIYLGGRVPLSAVTEEDLDRLLGAVLTTADESFNVILELGFASSIRKEWEWRRSRGESTANLEAFRGWLEADEADEPDEAAEPSGS
jgi:hypothetical protein